jgi:uncharacterized protein (TIGR02145 family)
MLKFKKNSKYLAIGAVALLITGFFFHQNFTARSASYSFFQTDWSGGVSGTTAQHPGDATGWNRYASSDNIVATGTSGQISLSTTTSSWTQTETADFLTGTFSGAMATSGKVMLRKPEGVACVSHLECLDNFCRQGYCWGGETIDYEGQRYSVVRIGEQYWMGDNLNVGNYVASVNTGLTHSDVTNNGTIEKYCYDNNTSNCDTDGGLYDWNEMMGYVTTPGVQGICPSGWHIPTDAEWYTLESGLATSTCSSSRTDWGCDPAGTLLKVGGASDFEALLAGYRGSTGSWHHRGSTAYFWSSSESGSDAWRRHLYSSESRVYRSASNKALGFSVRCLKN